MELTLVRDYWPTHTYARIPELGIVTIERPWIPNDRHGSKPYESCIPEGWYDLAPHNGRQYQNTWAMVNPELQVYHHKTDAPGGNGRFTCVFHVGNWVSNSLGCPLPGLRFAEMKDPSLGQVAPAVVNSGKAMDVLRDTLGVGTEGHKLHIVSRWG